MTGINEDAIRRIVEEIVEERIADALDEYRQERAEMPLCGGQVYSVDEYGYETGELSVCGEPAHRSDIDPRFGVPLCRECFYDAAADWRRANQEAGLCACGQDCLPGIKTCRDCTARNKRNAAKAAKQKKRREQEAADRARYDEMKKAALARRKALTADELVAAYRPGMRLKDLAVALGMTFNASKYFGHTSSDHDGQGVLGAMRRLGLNFAKLERLREGSPVSGGKMPENGPERA